MLFTMQLWRTRKRGGTALSGCCECQRCGQLALHHRHPVWTAVPVRHGHPGARAACLAEIANVECLCIVCRSNSSWASPLHIVPKLDGGCRPCGDHHRLNGVTTLDWYPVPHMLNFLAWLAGKVIFSKVDLVWGYYQVPVHLEDISKTAVITPFGLFEFLRMSFGLKNTAQAFLCLMDSVLRDLTFLFWRTSSSPATGRRSTCLGPSRARLPTTLSTGQQT
ncbi:hypothetical protein AAFF_G00194790 [Aldrovandia affinis]|uniref:Uncharacterized protein n=1 Tax=Aldrovandia affinis TaxID=143900 RepID=A0AAD7SXQ2_9TELE|nr:hypothetical protein AAFF_G00194790 [Aldrovandia affinis]